jgi:hypothetical protein
MALSLPVVDVHSARTWTGLLVSPISLNDQQEGPPKRAHVLIQQRLKMG